MKIALSEAEKAFKKNEVPVGAVIVCKGQLLAKAHNQRESVHDPTAHAEIIAIQKAAKDRGNWRFDECEMYVSKEPCPMCAGAIQQARFDKLVFGCSDEKAGYAGSLYNILTDERLPHNVEVLSGIEAAKCKKLLQDFFKMRRK